MNQLKCGKKVYSQTVTQNKTILWLRLSGFFLCLHFSLALGATFGFRLKVGQNHWALILCIGFALHLHLD